MRWLASILVVWAAACYRGGNERACQVFCSIDPATGDRGPCPGSLTCSARGVCTLPDGTCPTEPADAGGDAPADIADVGADVGIDGAPDAGGVCFGHHLQVCFAQQPTGTITLSGDNLVDTTQGVGCTVQGTSTDGICVISGATISVPVGSRVRAVGARPFVMVATGGITVAGTIDVSNHGAGAPSSDCDPGVPPVASELGVVGGGGAGGSAGGQGGGGGTSSNLAGGLPGALVAPFRGQIPQAGCDGQPGALVLGGTGPVPNGLGGGVFYAIATNISVQGSVDASGGGAPTFATCGSQTRASGGGGGSGGLIAFDASVVSIAGVVIANGGGGASSTEATGCGGVGGADPTMPSGPAAGGDAAGVAPGGDGGYQTVLAGRGTTSNTSGGGGGGGGVGYVLSYVAVSGPNISPLVSPL